MVAYDNDTEELLCALDAIEDDRTEIVAMGQGRDLERRLLGTVGRRSRRSRRAGRSSAGHLAPRERRHAATAPVPQIGGYQYWWWHPKRSPPRRHYTWRMPVAG